MPDDRFARKAECAMVATAAGDALGWPQEREVFHRDNKPEEPSPNLRAWDRRKGGRHWPVVERVQAGEYSDDTQLTLAVARCRLSGADWRLKFTRTELPLWTLYQRGGGRATRAAAEAWTEERPPWTGPEAEVRQYLDAGGNGVAMRALPHAIVRASDDDAARLVDDVLVDGIATHGNPRALLGASVFALAGWWLLRAGPAARFSDVFDALDDGVAIWGRMPPDDEWRRAAAGREAGWAVAVDEMRRLLLIAKNGIGSDIRSVMGELGCLGRTRGAGSFGTAGVLHVCARHAEERPCLAVVDLAFMDGADTDTLASMAGGLMGCFAAPGWMPDGWSVVQDGDHIRRLAAALAGGKPAEPWTRRARALGRRDLERIKAALADGARIDLDGARSARVVPIAEPPRAGRDTITVRGFKLLTDDGQTIFINRLGRPKKTDNG